MPVPLENAVALGRIGGPLLAENLIRKNTGLGEENLAFHNTSDTDNILYLNVIDGKIGINTDNPQAELEVASSIRSTDYLTSSASIAKFSISTNRIINPFAGVNGKIFISPNQLLDPTIQGPRFETLNLGLDDKLIENFTLNSDINLNPNGTGQVYITTSELVVNGDLTVTGKATWDGNLVTIGNSDSDNVVFNADVNSNIIPDDNETWTLGSAQQSWNNLYVKNLIANDITANSSYIANSIDLLLEQGKTIYVSVNGSDTSAGTHEHGTYRTIKHALSQATSGDSVVIFPGVYEEEFPLTVLSGVSVNGAGIRSVTVVPTLATNTNNAFLLNGDTTVSNLTVKDFYQGYAFSFVTSFTVLNRSPYVQNITVITSGPNAGNGAFIDGSLANNSSKEASMLFHSVTMIIPDAIGIHATNGARVEWLNSFTYYANKGIYLTQGSSGFAGLGLKFGAELRSIGSANVYGVYGAVADGASTLAYLIGHNFAYIGTGLDSTNDPKLVIQANEVVEQNNGHIYYESVDHRGDMRIGDIFYINQETGAVVFDAQAINFSAGGYIALESPTSSVYIDATQVNVGNINIHDNNIDSLIGPVNFAASSGKIYLNTDITVTGNLDITGSITVSGNVFLGDNSLDTIQIFPKISQNLEPDVTNTYSLGLGGVTPKTWRTLYLADSLNVDNVLELKNNTISTLTTNTNLELKAAGTGIINVTTTDVEITNNLTVNGLAEDSNFADIGITGLLDITGAWGQTGNALRDGYTDISGWLKVNGPNVVQFEDIQISNNTITTTVGNNDLELSASGLGIVKTILSDVEITNNLDVYGDGFFNSLEILNGIQVTDVNIDDIYIVGNSITTTVLDEDLILSANGTGVIKVTNTDVDIPNNLTIGNNLTVNGDSSFQFLEIDGTTTLVGNVDQTGNMYVTGNYQGGNIVVLPPSWAESAQIKLQGSSISVKPTNTDLELLANGTGGVIFDRQLKITANKISNIFDVNDITLSFNNILTTEDGQILILEDETDSLLADTKIDGDLSIIFEPNGIGNVIINSTKALAIAVGTAVLERVGEIRQNTDGVYEGYSNNSNVSFTGIYDTDHNTYITAELTPGANDNTIRMFVNNSLKSYIDTNKLYNNVLHVDSVSITNNTITNLNNANDLRFVTSGTGVTSFNGVYFKDNSISNSLNTALTITSTGTGYVKFAGTNGVVIPVGADVDRRLVPEIGETRYNTDRDYVEIFDGTSWLPVNGGGNAATEEEIQAETNLWAFILG